MPKIEVNRDIFYSQVGKKLTPDELVDILECAKGELDEIDDASGVLKIELNDTNRPDLWSTMGLARQLACYRGEKRKAYGFFSTQAKQQKNEKKKIIVDKNLKNIRPFIAAFVATGPKIDDAHLIDLIQSQEKLCGNYGSKRKTIAMGVYRENIISYPIQYSAADPDKTMFVPLEFDRELSLREICEQHPKGIEFGLIVKDFPRYPFLTDANGEVLSFPPIINSAKLGAVKVGDEKLFVELTGTDIDTLLLACSVVACDLADAGYSIEPVTVVYPYDTPYGKEITTPFYFQKEIQLNIEDAIKLLGDVISVDEAAKAIERMGNPVRIDKNSIILAPPEFRNDFMHPVDIIEEIVMGKGLKAFTPVMPKDFTVGRLSPQEEFSRKAREIMTGLGFQEMIYNYLGSKKDFIEKMKIPGTDVIEILNPMTENYEIVRNSILPNLLMSESVSANAVYPHRIFESGKIARKDSTENYGSKTENHLAFLVAESEVGFNEASALVSGLFFYMGKEYTLAPLEDPRFIGGRSARIIFGNKEVGLMGEIHPEILEAWNIVMPCIAVEVNLDLIRG
ncbi:MAG: phenylalanine--tRNA ligase subunit beta [Spirochaetales bacterium]|nr:phenylalanine--tRNA ligase subunit beta [Spirochaetales bacterium]